VGLSQGSGASGRPWHNQARLRKQVGKRPFREAHKGNSGIPSLIWQAFRSHELQCKACLHDTLSTSHGNTKQTKSQIFLYASLDSPNVRGLRNLPRVPNPRQTRSHQSLARSDAGPDHKQVGRASSNARLSSFDPKAGIIRGASTEESGEEGESSGLHCS